MLKEFQTFIMRGNVIELAVGIIIGAAFTAIVNSVVNDLIMPPIGLLVGGVDFSNIVITLQEATADTEAVTINIGLFINALIEFIIIAFVVFMLVRFVNNTMARFEDEPEEEAPAEPTTEEKLLDAINDLTAAIEKQNS
ncbi:MAG: large-conductance mechanosensitive channel protein MscL [Chloroflexota bacterium]